jgi:putative transposase
MSEYKSKSNRRSIRLKEYDYTSPGWYYITICTHNRECLFGEVIKGKMVLSPIGKTVQEYWLQIPNHLPNIELDEYVIMPNHIHGIIIINDKNVNNRRGVRSNAPTNPNITINPDNYFSQISPKSGSLSTIIRSYKSAVTKRVNELHNTAGAKLWQRGYYDRIIRNDWELYEIRKYIINNPLKWHLDNENPDNLKIQ